MISVISNDFKWFQVISNFSKNWLSWNHRNHLKSVEITWNLGRDIHLIAVISNDFRWFQVISSDFGDFEWFRVISSWFRDLKSVCSPLINHVNLQLIFSTGAIEKTSYVLEQNENFIIFWLMGHTRFATRKMLSPRSLTREYSAIAQWFTMIVIKKIIKQFNGIFLLPFSYKIWQRIFKRTSFYDLYAEICEEYLIIKSFWFTQYLCFETTLIFLRSFFCYFYIYYASAPLCILCTLINMSNFICMCACVYKHMPIYFYFSIKM
jgi:hypothetical protein